MRYTLFIVVSALFFFSGCSSKQPFSYEPYNSQASSQQRADITSSAQKYLRKKDGGDCSGFIMLVNKENREPFF